MLPTLADESIDCVVTSPPYWGLRNYGVAGQIGLEATLQEHMTTLIIIFREVRRILKTAGTVWLNYGDAYAGSWGAQSRSEAPGPLSSLSGGQVYAAPKGTHTGSAKRTPGLKPKDRMLLPARLALALQEDGWWVRDEIIWHKPNPMPSSVKDRTTPAHEMIYMLSKAERYFYDHEAIKEPAVTNGRMKVPAGWDTGSGAHGTIHREGRQPHKNERSGDRQKEGFNARWDAKEVVRNLGAKGQQTPYDVLASAGPRMGRGAGWRDDPVNTPETRSKRSVWTVSPKGFKEAHFATFPPDLIRPCILAGCPAGGVVLDPFYGAGTVGVVCQETDRNCVGIEINPAYVKIAKQRIQ